MGKEEEAVVAAVVVRVRSRGPRAMAARREAVAVSGVMAAVLMVAAVCMVASVAEGMEAAARQAAVRATKCR